MNKTSIEYLTHSWNPIAMRCTPVSEACANCWHLAMAKRMAANPTLSDPKRAAYAGGAPCLIKKELDAPLRRKKPARIGVQFMGDLFNPAVPFKIIDGIFGTMAWSQQHTYLILTKRPGRALEWAREYDYGDWMPPNVLLGASAENQQRADERIPPLLRIPAVGHFVSLEPMLGRIDLAPWLPLPVRGDLTYGEYDTPVETSTLLSWVIVGGESGPGARPPHPQWVRDVRDQCQEAAVPFLFKGWGSWGRRGEGGITLDRGAFGNWEEMGHSHEWLPGTISSHGEHMVRVGKRAAGRLLDGELWDEYPEPCQ